MTLLAWLAALVALLTGFAMLKDTHVSTADRAEMRAITRRAWAACRSAGGSAVDRVELSRVVRLFLRLIILVLIVASAGICVLFPFGAGRPPDLYDVMLRCAMAAFLAMQAPCPWWRYIVFGERRRAGVPANKGAVRHVH